MRSGRRGTPQRGGQPQMRGQGASRGGEASRSGGERRPGNPKTATDAKPKRQGAPPKDPELNSLLRSFIRKTHENARVEEIFADIETRAGQSEALMGEAVEMFKLMLSYRDNYGTRHAQSLAEDFLGKHGKARQRGARD